MSKTLSQIYSNPETRGEVSVIKSYRVPVSQIYIEPGLNVKNTIYRDVVDAFKKAYLAGDFVPNIVVEPQDNGTFKVIDGHHRFTAVQELVQEGHEFKRITVEGFNGSKADQVALMITSSQGRNLTPVERATAYARLISTFGWTDKEVAEKFSVSVSSVIHHMNIDELSDSVKQMINDGKIAADYAVQLYRKHGESGVTDKVSEAGETKATRKSAGGYRPSMGKSVVSLLSTSTPVINGDTVTMSMTVEQWEEVQKAIDALSKE